MSNLFLVTNSESCDRSLLSVYAITSNSLISKPLKAFNGLEAFEYLKELHVVAQAGVDKREKLMPVDVSENFENALSAYKRGDKKKFKEYMGYFVLSGEGDVGCTPDAYVVDKYYYPKMVGWSNDVGFLFGESGYYAESVALLERIVSDNPDRVVAYLNLADAYWGLGKRELAIEYYKKYSLLMEQSGKTARIPKRVNERS